MSKRQQDRRVLNDTLRMADIYGTQESTADRVACPRCAARILVTELAQHLETCSPKEPVE